jgi:hypothetical protein
MVKALFKSSGQASKLLQLCFVFLFFAILSLGVLTALGVDATDNSSLRLNLIIQGLGMFLLPAFFLAYLWAEKPLSYLSLNKKVNLPSLIYVFLLMLVVIPLVNLLVSLNNQIVFPEVLAPVEAWMRNMEQSANSTTESLLNVAGYQQFMLNLFLIAIVPALSEELFFRGVIIRILSEKKHYIIAIWVAAILFSAIHLQFYGFFPRMLMGALFGYLLLWSGSIWLPIFAHFLNNAFVVIYSYLKFNNFDIIDMDVIGSGDSWWLGVLSGLFSALFVVILYKKNRKSEFI